MDGRGAPGMPGPGLIDLRESFEHNPDDTLQHGNHYHREKKIEDSAKHYPLPEGASPRRCLYSIFGPDILLKPLFFLGGFFAGRVDTGLGVPGGDER